MSHDEVPEVPRSQKLNARGKSYQPGDLILDRYMPDATDEEREAARENLRQYAEVLFRVTTRLATEEVEARNKFDSPYPPLTRRGYAIIFARNQSACFHGASMQWSCEPWRKEKCRQAYDLAALFWLRGQDLNL